METPITPSPTNSSPSHASHAAAGPGHLNAVEIVWQWASYVLWEGVVIALSSVVAITLTYYFDNASLDLSQAVPYAIAALVCLFPLAFVADRMFAKAEPIKKEGFAAVIMVLNAVVALLIAVGAVITAVMVALSEALNGVSAGDNITVATALVVSLFGALLFMRITRPARLVKLAAMFPLIMGILAVVVIVVAVIGPFVHGLETQTERLIENNLATLDQDIQTYAETNSALPANLNALDFSGDYDTGAQSGQTLVKKGLVSYAPNITTGDYTLCVTYDKAKGTGQNSSSSVDSSIDTTNHAAGQVCYRQTASDFVTTPLQNSTPAGAGGQGSGK